MSLDNGQHSTSPAESSGEASPAARAPRRQFDEDEPPRRDKSFRRYAAGVERALASFDTARLEWPDYISFLGRLLKAVQAHPPAVDSLPHRFAVANRLAQCLKSSLPSGVHQKAIEVYSYIFSFIGKDNLSLDLHVYLPGLSSVLTFASLSLRPIFLSLLETHIVVLDGVALRPPLKALILSLVPGLEDETNEDFDRTLQIVDNLKDAVGSPSRSKKEVSSGSRDEYFWQCFFLASISSSSRRQGSLAFLNRRLPKLFTVTKATSTLNVDLEYEGKFDDALPPEAESVVSPEPGLLIRCLTAGLEDEQMLIQRGYLDLLLTHLPLHSPVLANRVDLNDLVRLVGAATGVITRRDMSLNRRLWSWFLGPETADEIDEDGTSESTLPNGTSRAVAYFTRYGAKPLIADILEKLSQSPSEPAARAKPFRICLSLMDRWEIGSVVIPQVFLPAMENISRYQKTSTETNFQDTVRSAHSFFDGIESGVIWGQILQLGTVAMDDPETGNDSWEQRLQLAIFIVGQFNVQEEEMLLVHLPLIMLASLASITFHLSKKVRNASSMSDKVLGNALLLAETLVHLMPERVELNSSFMQQEADIANTADEPYQIKLVRSIKRFYTESKGNLSISPPPLSSRKVSELLINESTKLLLFDSAINQSSLNIRVQAGILSSLMAKLPVPESVDYGDIISRLYGSLRNAGSLSGRVVPFTNLNAITHLLGTISSLRPEMNLELTEDFAGLISCLSEAVWDYLSPSAPKYHLEAVRCLWKLDDLNPDKCFVEALIARSLGPSISRPDQWADSVEAAQNFTVLWNHTSSPGSQAKRYKNTWSKSFLALDQTTVLEDPDYQRRLIRPLFLLVDASDDAGSELQFFVRNWLEGLSNSYKIFEVLLTSITDTQPKSHYSATDGDARSQIEHADRRPECVYHLQRLSGLLDLASDDMWAGLCQILESKTTEEHDEPTKSTMLESIAQVCLEVIRRIFQENERPKSKIDNFILRSALSIMRKVLECPGSSSLQKLKLEDPLIGILRLSLISQNTDASCQVALLDTLSAALKVRSMSGLVSNHPRLHRRAGSVETGKQALRSPVNQDSNEALPAQDHGQRLAPPSDFVKCLLEGLKLSSSNTLLEKWIQFLIEVLPLFSSALFQSLIPLVETLCRRIGSIFEDIKKVFMEDIGDKKTSPEPALMSLLNGLEATLTAGHDQMARDEPKRSAPKSPEPQQGFFGNVVSGVFSTESHKSRSSAANTRLTVILCFQDALRVCLSIWSWGGINKKPDQQDPSSLASFGYVSQRLRNKTRRIMDHMFVAETLECLETIISIRAKEDSIGYPRNSPSAIYLLQNRESPRDLISLLHVLEGSFPKNTMPALFNAIYSRTTPSSIELKWVSTLTTDLTELEISHFLVEYTQSLDDDAMDEIWSGCIAFLRDVLTNPLPHRQILPNLLLFLVILAEKMDKTNFGEQRKMRKELGDLLLRYLTATFTTNPGGSHQDAVHSRSNSEKRTNGDTTKPRPSRRKPQYLDFVDTLTAVVPRLPAVLTDTDRLVTAFSSISTHVISPLVHSKHFPAIIREEYLSLWLALVRVNNASKIWKKDISESFMHSKFFSTPLSLALSSWAPLVYQWTLVDKDRITELCARITAPTSAGLVFGVGANAARLDADKKTQLNLRRIAFVILAAEEDFAVPSLSTLEEKITDLLNASVASSPSSSTRAEVFMLIRSLILKTTLVHLSFLWPVVTSELQKAIFSALPRSPDFDTYNMPSMLQACKLLDLLINVSPDDFQVHEWLFITDTIDAVYRPGNWDPIALVDDVAEELGPNISADGILSPAIKSREELNRTQSGNVPKPDADPSTGSKYRTPLLKIEATQNPFADTSKDDFVAKVLRPFFAQLSIHSYEATYSMKGPDLEECKFDLVEDLFDDSTFVG